MNRWLALMALSALLVNTRCVCGVNDRARYTCGNDDDCIEVQECSGVQSVPAGAIDDAVVDDFGVLDEGDNRFLTYCLPRGDNACGNGMSCLDWQTCAAVSLPETAAYQYCVLVKKNPLTEWWKILVTTDAAPSGATGAPIIDFDLDTSGSQSHQLKLWRRGDDLVLYVDGDERAVQPDRRFYDFDQIILLAFDPDNLNDGGTFDDLDIRTCTDIDCAQFGQFWLEDFEYQNLGQWIASGAVRNAGGVLNLTSNNSEQAVAMRLHNAILNESWEVWVRVQLEGDPETVGFCMQKGQAGLRCLAKPELISDKSATIVSHDCPGVFSSQCVMAPTTIARPLCARVFSLASNEAARQNDIVHQCVPVGALTMPTKNE